MRLLSIFSVLSLATIAITAPVAQESSLIVRDSAKLAELSTRTDVNLQKRINPIVNGAVYGACQGLFVNIQDLAFITGLGRLVTADTNIPLAAQAIRDGMTHAPDPPAGSRALSDVANAGQNGQYRFILMGGESTAEFAPIVLIPVINDALAGMQQQGRGGVQFTIRDEQHRIVFKLVIIRVG